MPYKPGFLPAVLLAAGVLVAPIGCADNGRPQEEPRIASINDTPILLRDFEREVTTATRRDPTIRITEDSLAALLDSMVERKLLIQEAVAMGLSENERFLATIKAYWEQTLIRELIDSKTAEWADKTFVTDDEVHSYYRLMGTRVTVRSVNTSTAAEAESARLAMSEGGRLRAEQTMGPFSSADIPPSNPLHAAFDLEEGEAKVLKGENGYTTILMERKETVQTAPFKEVDSRIKTRLLEQKRQKALDDWLADLKESSRITVNTELLRGMTNE